MVALTLGLLVMIGVIQVFISTQQSAQIAGGVADAGRRPHRDGGLMSRYIRVGRIYNPSLGQRQYHLESSNQKNARGFPASGPFAVGQVVSGGENNVNGVDSIRIRYQAPTMVRLLPGPGGAGK